MSADEHAGPVILREKPQVQLVDRAAYAIPEDATADDFAGAAAWVRFHGGEVKFVDNEGLLVVSRHGDLAYHEWVGADSLLVHSPDLGDEFSTYGYGMADHYVVEPTAEGLGR